MKFDGLEGYRVSELLSQISIGSGEGEVGGSGT